MLWPLGHVCCVHWAVCVMATDPYHDLQYITERESQRNRESGKEEGRENDREVGRIRGKEGEKRRGKRK